jgi:hypothetical protein
MTIFKTLEWEDFLIKKNIKELESEVLEFWNVP